jgi:hypothetical protein
MPPHQRLRLENCNDLQDRRKPSIHLEEEPAIVVGKPGPDGHLAPQKDQLMSERSILSLKPALRLEWRGQHGQNKSKSVRTSRQFSRFYHSINPDRIFGTHNGHAPGTPSREEAHDPPADPSLGRSRCAAHLPTERPTRENSLRFGRAING